MGIACYVQYNELKLEEYQGSMQRTKNRARWIGTGEELGLESSVRGWELN